MTYALRAPKTDTMLLNQSQVQIGRVPKSGKLFVRHLSIIPKGDVTLTQIGSPILHTRQKIINATIHDMCVFWTQAR